LRGNSLTRIEAAAAIAGFDKIDAGSSAPEFFHLALTTVAVKIPVMELLTGKLIG